MRFLSIPVNRGGSYGRRTIVSEFRSEKSPVAPAEPVLEYRAANILQYSSAAAAVDDFVHVYRAADYLEANLLMGKLQEAGMHARVDMENATALGHWGMTGHAGTNVQVLQSEVARAREVVDEIERARAARRSAYEMRCPKCNHHPVKRQFRPVRLAALAAILLCFVIGIFDRVLGISRDVSPTIALSLFVLGLVLLFVPSLPRWRCPACGNQWAQAEPEEKEEEDDEDDEEA